jgi:hypothetical protein
MRASGLRAGAPAAHRPRRAPRAAAAAAATPLAAAAPLALPRGRRACVRVAAAARGRRGGGKGASTRKGFAKPDARAMAEPWEADLPPFYRAYYKAGFKPQRFVGPIDLRKNSGARAGRRFSGLRIRAAGSGCGHAQPPGSACAAAPADDECAPPSHRARAARADGTVDVVTQDVVGASQALAVVPALMFLEGAFSEPPSIDELHAGLLARGAAAPPGVARVLRLLPRAPPEGGGDGDGADAAAGAEGDSGGSGVAAPAPSPLLGAATILDLDPKLWVGRAEAGTVPATAPPPTLLGEDDLLAVLQASCYGEDYLDPATSQLRHELPVGFIGVWPELAAMRHSCVPNTAVAIVGGGYAFIHAAAEAEAGTPLTTNKIGGWAARGKGARFVRSRPCISGLQQPR